MQHLSNSLRLRRGVFLAFLATLLAAASLSVPCEGQYSADNGTGMTPLAPLAPGGNTVSMPGTRPPMEPGTGTRPETWPGAVPPAAPGIRQIPELPLSNQMQFCLTSQKLAIVGNELIVVGDVIGFVNRILEANKDRIPPDQYDKVREEILRRNLDAYIQNKRIFLDAKNSIPSEHWPNIEKQLAKGFEESEIARLMKQENAADRRELEEKLHKFGSSLEREKRLFVERELASQWITQQVKPDDEVTYDQMVKYYHEHQKEFFHPAKAKWEEISVHVTKYASEDEARNAIAQLGNQVLLQNQPFAEVAKRGSDGATAAAGGRWEWTSQGALRAKEIDAALFSLPVNQLSQIIRNDDYLSIVRVTDREGVGVTPFLDAQVEIRDKIVRQRFEKQKNEYLAKIKERIPVTMFISTPGTTSPAAGQNAPQTANLPQSERR